MRNLSIFIVILLGLDYKTNCQAQDLFKCPEVTTIEPFDLDRYMGTWYLHSINLNKTQARCHQVAYKNEGNGKVSVVLTEVGNETHSIIGTANVIKPGQLTVTFRNKTYDTPNHLILGTDYVKWAVVNSCVLNRNKLFIFTRERGESDESLVDAKQIIEKNKFNFSSMHKISQEGCPNISDPFENDKQNPEASSTTITSDSPSSTDSLVTSIERLMDDA